MITQLQQAGFQVHQTNHARAIIESDFKHEFEGLFGALENFSIPISELIGSGGGEAQSTQRLRHALNGAGWKKHNFKVHLIVDGVKRGSPSHEIDHVFKASAGTVAFEIEWNNKDPFFDRDLENFQRLHSHSAISLGVIVTRGETLQNNLPARILEFLKQHQIRSEQELVNRFAMKERTKRQSEAVQKMMDRGLAFDEAFTKIFVSDKFGAATTHWSKLMERIDRGVGNPCPLILIGLPETILHD